MVQRYTYESKYLTNLCLNSLPVIQVASQPGTSWSSFSTYIQSCCLHLYCRLCIDGRKGPQKNIFAQTLDRAWCRTWSSPCGQICVSKLNMNRSDMYILWEKGLANQSFIPFKIFNYSSTYIAASNTMVFVFKFNEETPFLNLNVPNKGSSS